MIIEGRDNVKGHVPGGSTGWGGLVLAYAVRGATGGTCDVTGSSSAYINACNRWLRQSWLSTEQSKTRVSVHPQLWN